jgi:cellulose synthase/poly-beta-1,6-N-acetylglucosamine synthase-like glycosyltransferase
MGRLVTMISIVLRLVELVSVAGAVALVLVAAGFLALPIVCHFRRPFVNAPPLAAESEDALPEVLVQLPVFNEPHVVEGLLESVAALDWPIEKLRIQLLDDSNDDTTATAAEKIAQLRARGLLIEHVRREQRVGFKAGALAAGLLRCAAPFVAILDADFRPPPNWLRAVIPQLAAHPDAGFIQSRCEFANAGDNLLTRAQGMLLDSHFLMEQALRARAGLLFQCNGTGAVWRREAIDAAGGWSDLSLSEDLDLAIRAALAGWRGLFSDEPVVPGLVPHEIRHWRVQQKRWSMGFAQNARTLAARIWAADWTLAKRVSGEFLLFYQVALPIIVITIVSSLIDIAWRAPDLSRIEPLWILTGVVAVALAVGMTLPPYLKLRRGGLSQYLATVAAVPVLVVVLAFLTLRAIFKGFLGRRDIFHRTPKVGAPALERN